MRHATPNVVCVTTFAVVDRIAGSSARVLEQPIQERNAAVVLSHQRLAKLMCERVGLEKIRGLIDKYPHRIVLVCDNYRALAAKLVTWDDVEGVKVLGKEHGVLVETRTPDAFYGRLPALSLEDGTAIREVYSDDDNLEAVFKYLVNGRD